MFDFKPIKNLEFVLLILEIIKPSMIYYCYYYLALCSSAFIALWIDMMTMGQNTKLEIKRWALTLALPLYGCSSSPRPVQFHHLQTKVFSIVLGSLAAVTSLCLLTANFLALSTNSLTSHYYLFLFLLILN